MTKTFTIAPTNPFLAQRATAITGNFTQYIDDDQWSAEEKFDGDRMILSLDNEGIECFNRLGDRSKLPALLSEIQVFPKGKYVLDGEILNDRFMVFDVLYFNSKYIGDIPLRKRQAILTVLYDAGKDRLTNCELSPVAYSAKDKRDLVDRCLHEQKEGVVFKKVNSKYWHGKNKDWMKLKFYRTSDVFISEMQVEGKPEAVELSVFDADGNVQSVGGCKIPLRYQQEQAIQVGDVIEARFLYLTKEQRLYQPNYLRKRKDKSKFDCTLADLVVDSKVAGEVLSYLD